MPKSEHHTTEPDIQITDDQANQFYELTVDGAYAGLLVYAWYGRQCALTHTYIEPSFHGQGLATQLIRHVMDHLRRKGTTATNYSPTVDAFLDTHPEYGDVVEALPRSRSATTSTQRASEMPLHLDNSGRRRIQARSGR